MAMSLASRAIDVTILEDDLGGDPVRTGSIVISVRKVGTATTTAFMTQSPPAGGVTQAEVEGWQALIAVADENMTALVTDLDAFAVEADA